MPSKPNGIAPHFLVEDVVRAAEYYRDKLGFDIGPYFQDPPSSSSSNGIAWQSSSHAWKAVAAARNRKWKNDAFDAYIWVGQVDRLYHDLAARNAEILQAPLLKDYGMKEMDVRDADGYVIRFGEDVPIQN